MHHRWKKNMAGIWRGHPECRYVATVDMSYPVLAMNSVRKALSIGGRRSSTRSTPAEGRDYDPMQSRTNWASWRCSPACGRSMRWKRASCA